MFFAIALPFVILILGTWITLKCFARFIRGSVNYIQLDKDHSFYWGDALKYKPSEEQWKQLQELCSTLPHIPELVSLSTDLAWAISNKDLTDARTCHQELEKKMYLLNLHNYESLEKPAEVGAYSTDCNWNC